MSQVKLQDGISSEDGSQCAKRGQTREAPLREKLQRGCQAKLQKTPKQRPYYACFSMKMQKWMWYGLETHFCTYIHIPHVRNAFHTTRNAFPGLTDMSHMWEMCFIWLKTHFQDVVMCPTCEKHVFARTSRLHSFQDLMIATFSLDSNMY